MSIWSASSRLEPDLVAQGREEGEQHPAADEQRVTRGSRCPITPSLSETFEPPSTTTYGRSGFSVSRSSTSSSAAISRPAALGSACASSYTLACLRWTTPKPSETNASPNAASLAANASRSPSSLLVSPGLNRRFSSRATSPSSRPATASCGAVADRVARERHRLAEQLAEPLGDRREAVLRVGRALGAAEVRDRRPPWRPG